MTQVEQACLSTYLFPSQVYHAYPCLVPCVPHLPPVSVKTPDIMPPYLYFAHPVLALPCLHMWQISLLSSSTLRGSRTSRTWCYKSTHTHIQLAFDQPEQTLNGRTETITFDTGALFGLGAALAFFYWRHKEVLQHHSDAMLRSLGFTAAANLAYSLFINKSIDNWWVVLCGLGSKKYLYIWMGWWMGIDCMLCMWSFGGLVHVAATTSFVSVQ